MSNAPNRFTFLRDKRVLFLGGGVLTATLVITLSPLMSTAAPAVPTVRCPDASARLAGVAIPAAAQAEVSRNLALLNTQINEANQRIASTVGQGGPNFINNAILGPLASKRAATLDRIRIAIERQRATAPQNLGALATCTLNAAGAGNAGNANAGNANAGNANDGNGNANGNGNGNAQPPAGQQGGGNTNGLQTLGNSCAKTRLQPHNGFQEGNRCVSTAFGEVASQDKNPTLLITSAPQSVAANTAFELRVSTRNLVRDRFLAAGQGGYYLESAFLTRDGITRGHFHTACRMLTDTQNAPASAPAPAFFVATEDGGGGADPDTVTVRVSGLPRGLAQCAVWAGDGSHRVPMMQRANQTPAFDVVRIVVR